MTLERITELRGSPDKLTEQDLVELLRSTELWIKNAYRVMDYAEALRVRAVVAEEERDAVVAVLERGSGI